jgi:hypothetical protein
MPTPDSPSPADEVESALRALDRELCRLRIPRARRAELVEEVRADLRAASADGVPPQVLLGDVETFAREAVAARGWTPRPRDRSTGTAVALLAGAVAIVVGYVVVVELLTPLFSYVFDLDGSYPVAGGVLAVAFMALAGLTGALATFGWVFAGRPAARASVLRAAWYLPIGAALGIVAAVAFAESQGYPTSAPVIAVEILLVAVPCAAALWLARWWGVRATEDADPERVSAG